MTQGGDGLSEEGDISAETRIRDQAGLWRESCRGGALRAEDAVRAQAPGWRSQEPTAASAPQGRRGCRRPTQGAGSRGASGEWPGRNFLLNVEGIQGTVLSKAGTKSHRCF